MGDTSRAGSDHSARRRVELILRTLVIGLSGFLLVILAVYALHLQDQAKRDSQRASRIAASRRASNLQERSWPFLAGTPADWVNLASAHLTGGGLAVKTSATLRYQLVSPPFVIQPGRAVAQVRCEVESGGLQLGVVDVRTQRFLATRAYSAVQTGRRPFTAEIFFRVRPHRRMFVVLSNSPVGPAPSAWLIRRARVAAI